MTSPTIDISPRQVTPAPRARGRFIALAVLCLAEPVGVMDNIIINIGVLTLGRAFDVSTIQLQWIVDAYTLASAVLMLPGGYLGDRVGRRKTLIMGLLGSVAISFVSAITIHIAVLTGLRALLGICAALMFPTTLSLISTIFKGIKYHALAVGLWAATAGFGIVLGPVVGGLLLEHFEWLSLFWVNIVIALPVAGISLFPVPEFRSNKLGWFDAVGMCLAIAVLGLLVGSTIEGPQLGQTALPVLGGLAISTLSVGAPMAQEKRVDSPMLDLNLFRTPSAATCSSTIGPAFFPPFGFMFIITIYLQAVRDCSTLQVGLAILSFTVAMGTCSPLAPVLVRRFGIGCCVLFGIALTGVGSWIISFADVTNSYWAIMVLAMIFMAVGLTFVQGLAIDTILSAVPSDGIGVASGVDDSIREIGGTIGVAILGSILTHVYRDQMLTVTSTSPSLSVVSDSIMVAQQIAATLSERSQQAALRATAPDAFLSAFHINCLILTGITPMASILIAFRLVHNARH